MAQDVHLLWIHSKYRQMINNLEHSTKWKKCQVLHFFESWEEGILMKICT